MNVKQAYNLWSEQYDTNTNKTRDLEAISLRTFLANIPVDNCLEIGCGTGKNTEWLVQKANQVTAVDLSDKMLIKAKSKISSDNVHFIQADITEPWNFGSKSYNLITFSLVLEHIQDLNAIFSKSAEVIAPKGYIYVSELHPFKQYTGSKARFETEEGQQLVTCFTHHLSDFTDAAKRNNFEIVQVTEYFDEDDRSSIPRILTLLFQRR